VSVTDIQLDFIDLALAVNPPPTVKSSGVEIVLTTVLSSTVFIESAWMEELGRLNTLAFSVTDGLTQYQKSEKAINNSI